VEVGGVARQFVVQLENQPGELTHLARALAARDIDIRHIGGVGIADAAERLARTGVYVQGHPHGRRQAGARRDDLLRRRRDEGPCRPARD